MFLFSLIVKLILNLSSDLIYMSWNTVYSNACNVLMHIIVSVLYSFPSLSNPYSTSIISDINIYISWNTVHRNTIYVYYPFLRLSNLCWASILSDLNIHISWNTVYSNACFSNLYTLIFPSHDIWSIYLYIMEHQRLIGFKWMIELRNGLIILVA